DALEQSFVGDYGFSDPVVARPGRFITDEDAALRVLGRVAPVDAYAVEARDVQQQRHPDAERRRERDHDTVAPGRYRCHARNLHPWLADRILERVAEELRRLRVRHVEEVALG